MKCKRCNQTIYNGDPFHKENDDYYCGDCAFINGFIDKEELIDSFYFFIDKKIIGVPMIINNKVEFVSPSFSKAKEDNDFRKTPEYIKWRDSVYKRDNYTCQMCHTKGGNLNAHHIKPFSKYKELRLQIENGITLCEKCHKKVHKDKRNKNAGVD